MKMSSKEIAKRDKDLELMNTPVNFNERVAYASLMRLDALCDMLSSLIEHIAKKEDVPVTTKKVVEKVTKPTPKKKKVTPKKKEE